MKKGKETTYKVTEEEYQEGLQKGWNDDDMLRPGTYKVRRSRHINKDVQIKEKISINLDADVLAYFRANAAKSRVPYQTQINQYLRRVLEEEHSTSVEIEGLLNDKDFLKKLKEKLAAV